MKADGRFVSMIWSQAEGLLRYLPVLFQKPFASGESGPEQSGLLSVAEGFGSKSAATHTHNDGLASFVAGDGTMSAPGVSFQGQLRRRRATLVLGSFGRRNVSPAAAVVVGLSSTSWHNATANGSRKRHGTLGPGAWLLGPKNKLTSPHRKWQQPKRCTALWLAAPGNGAAVVHSRRRLGELVLVWACVGVELGFGLVLRLTTAQLMAAGSVRFDSRKPDDGSTASSRPRASMKHECRFGRANASVAFMPVPHAREPPSVIAMILVRPCMVVSGGADSVDDENPRVQGQASTLHQAVPYQLTCHIEVIHGLLGTVSIHFGERCNAQTIAHRAYRGNMGLHQQSLSTARPVLARSKEALPCCVELDSCCEAVPSSEAGEAKRYRRGLHG
ncbi:hypothetical protein PCL_08226 [Purpureocillium lilacinum]|uniref:Uncharacterized protein n=1 Tax=Purpureocillium lilacinum TaxID=33203 RepID=A0A2U3EKA7_PURLI|nr:hypothetical protein PCL_08226 [Purpureocillium lilacinum]